MNLRDDLSALFLRDLLPSAAARAFVLHQAAEAEASDEIGVFDAIAAKVDDPELAKLVKKHRDDEVRHAEMFRACVARQGVAPLPLPDELRLVDAIDRELDGIFGKPVDTARAVMELYLVLQVVEERAVHQFAHLERAMRLFDPSSAAAIAAIAKDEARHLKYCHAISRRYAPDALTRAETLGRFRVAEAKAFRDHSRRNMAFMLDHGLVASKVKTAMWRGVASFTARSNELPFTAFARATPLDRAPIDVAIAA